MAKKSKKKDELLKSNNSIITELRNDRWIYNPVVYSQISGDFTLLQQRILVGIVERLQQRIIDSIEEQKSKKSFPAIFEEGELAGKEVIELNIPADDLGVLPSHYAQLQQAMESLANISMKYPRYGANGKIKSYVIAHLFSRIEMPVYQKKVDDEDVDGKRTGILRVVMLKENISDIFTMQHGYIKHISQITCLAQKKRTPRLYIYLSRYKEFGHKRVPYTDLVEYLGLTDEYYFQSNYGSEERKETTVNPYSEWNRVKSQVLMPVQKEMKELADRGDIDIYFEFEPIYPKGKTRGTPAEILFNIKKSQMGEEHQLHDKRINTIYQFIDKYIDWCPDLSKFSLLAIVEDLSDELLEKFIDFAFNDVRRIVESKQPDDVASYVLGVLRKWKKDKLAAKVQTLQQDLFSMQAEEEREQRRKEEEERNKVIPGAYVEEWQQLLSRCSSEYKFWLNKATHKGSLRGFMFISFADKKDCDGFNKFETENEKLHKEFEKLLMDIFNGQITGRVLIRGVEGE